MSNSFGNLLSSKFVGRHLSSEQEKEAVSWLTSKQTEWPVPFLAFKIKDTQIYPPPMLADDVIKYFSSVQWWSILEIC